MAAVNGTALVAAPINVTGALFNKTRVDTPLFNMIKRNSQASRTFVTGASFDTGYPNAAVNGISETASLTAPDPQFWARTNGYNVTQIFQRSLAVSYRKLANTADLNQYGVNSPSPIALTGLTNNVPNELAFQIANCMDSIRLDLEYTILNGTFADGGGASGTADQTRGLIEAISTNVVNAASSELNYDLIYTLAQTIMLSGTPFSLDSYICVLNYEQFKQLQKVVADEGLKISPESGGTNIMAVITPFGVMRFMPHRFCPNGTAVLACVPILGNVFQETPGKGNFFFEPLAKTGAADKGQVFGMWGLDHGNEWMHAKITGLSTTTEAFTAPKRFIVNYPSASAVNGATPNGSTG